MEESPKIIVVMGVSGCGKSTVGKLVAGGLRCEFVEGDEYHTPENIAKMGSGHPLEDEDRRGWMAALNRKLCEVVQSGGRAVLACSALKAIYRVVQLNFTPEITSCLYALILSTFSIKFLKQHMNSSIYGVIFSWNSLYREWLTEGLAGRRVRFIFIRGDFEAISQRMEERRGHYMKANMLRSQFDALEEPEGAHTHTYDLSLGSDLIAKQALDALSEKN